MKSNYLAVAVLCLGIALGALGIWYWQEYRQSPDTKFPTISMGTSTGATTTKRNDIQITGIQNVEGTGLEGATITLGSVGGGSSGASVTLPPAPSLERPFQAPASYSAEAAAILIKQHKDTVGSLKADNSFLQNWIGLGTLYKIAGDYEGARIYWEYASLISPKNIVSFSNLGDLYHYYLKDYPQAEKNLRQVITNDPTYIVGYRNLSDLYRLSYKTDTALAADVLKQGLDKNPGALELMTALGSYYKEKNNLTEARSYYTQALTEAKIQKNNQAVQQITAELQSLN